MTCIDAVTNTPYNSKDVMFTDQERNTFVSEKIQKELDKGISLVLVLLAILFPLRTSFHLTRFGGGRLSLWRGCTFSRAAEQVKYFEGEHQNTLSYCSVIPCHIFKHLNVFQQNILIVFFIYFYKNRVLCKQ